MPYNQPKQFAKVSISGKPYASLEMVRKHPSNKVIVSINGVILFEKERKECLGTSCVNQVLRTLIQSAKVKVGDSVQVLIMPQAGADIHFTQAIYKHI